MYVALLGRQPAISIAELERVFGDVRWFGGEAALIDTEEPIDIQRLGGTQKLGVVVAKFPLDDWRSVSKKIVTHYSREWAAYDGKITLGISAYGFHTTSRDVQKTGLLLKNKLKGNTSLRLIPNQDVALSTATAHHNKLGLSDNKVELLVVRGKTSIVVAESVGTQNITALAARDQGRPKRDAFVGMLPPKLAQILINLAAPNQPARLLDPFCGTGVVLQEALLLGYDVYGTDLAQKMIDYSQANLDWLQQTAHINGKVTLATADAMDARWQAPIDAVATETYLGQPFSAPPSPSKLTEVRGNCDHIIGTFLKNLADQLESGTPVAVAVPAWRASDGSFTHLPLVKNVEKFGFTRVPLTTVSPEQLLYYRPDQIVARELLVLQKS